MKKFDLSLLCILLLALAGGLLILFASPRGIGLSQDSIQYIQAAHNLRLGFGLSIWGEQGYLPLAHFPPLYPLLLAAAASSIPGALAWGHGLQVLLFAANIASLGLIVWLCSPKNHWLGVLTAGVACCALPFLEIHTSAWSEPLFVLLSLWGLFLLYRYLEKPDWRLLIGAGSLVSLACLARYIGFAVVLSGAMSILLLSRKPFKHRFIDSLVFTLLSLLPIFTWLAYNATSGANSINRQFVYHPLSLAQIKTAVVVFTTWLAPMPLSNHTRSWLAIAFSSVLLFEAFLLCRRKTPQPLIRPVAFIVIFILSYMLALSVSLTFFDSSTPINNRLLAPVFAASLILAGCLVLATFRPFLLSHKLMVLLCFMWIIAAHLEQANGLLGEWRRQGLGYASLTWSQSDLLKMLLSIAPDGPIYSNEPEAIYLYTGQHTLPLPNIYSPFTHLNNKFFNAEMQHMGEKMRDNKGILVIFRTSSWRPHLATEQEILERLPLFPYLSGADGTIYTWKDGS